jgi:hypothetical protein
MEGLTAGKNGTGASWELHHNNISYRSDIAVLEYKRALMQVVTGGLPSSELRNSVRQRVGQVGEQHLLAHWCTCSHLPPYHYGLLPILSFEV